jgi:hypothetical protein
MCILSIDHIEHIDHIENDSKIQLSSLSHKLDYYQFIDELFHLRQREEK